MRNSKYQVISLFSGAGGLDYGFKQAGFQILGSVEIMKEAIQTHNFNFNLNSKPLDLTKKNDYMYFVNKFKNQKIDLLIGGFPCQGYSIAGKRDLNDKRNQLYKKIVSTLKDLKIKKFVLENVPGILSMDKGKEIKKIENFFNKNGFYFRYSVFDSSKFGVPQKRKRVIFLGSSNKGDLKKIEKIFWELSQNKTKDKNVKDAILDLEKSKENKEFSHIFTKHSQDMIQRIKKVQVGKSLYKNYQDGWRRIDYNLPSPTVKENHGGVHLHPVQNRVLTPRELARLQTFPDYFLFKGSKKMQLVQIGNAVPVKFAKEIAKKILNFI